MNFEKFKTEGKGLYLYSGTKGSGKTRLIASIANALIGEYGVNLRFITTVDLLNEIRDTYNSGSRMTESRLISLMCIVDVLMLDDIGVEPPKDWSNQIFYSILNERLNSGKVTLFTSNLRIEDLDYDERIKSRIGALAIPVFFTIEFN